MLFTLQPVGLDITLLQASLVLRYQPGDEGRNMVQPSACCSCKYIQSLVSIQSTTSTYYCTETLVYTEKVDLDNELCSGE